MQRLRNRETAGVTVIELMMYTVLAVVLSAVIYQSLRASSLLTTKNASLNRSHDSLRSAMDRMGNNIRTSRNLPSLLGASGDVVVSGPAAGIRYDRMAGEPYTLDPVTTAGSISSAATSISIYRSVLGIAPPPLPTDEWPAKDFPDLPCGNRPRPDLDCQSTAMGEVSPPGGVPRGPHCGRTKRTEVLPCL
jgi:hypothetical protein